MTDFEAFTWTSPLKRRGIEFVEGRQASEADNPGSVLHFPINGAVNLM